MICKKCESEFEPHHHRQKYCDECRVSPGMTLTRKGLVQTKDLPEPLGPLDVYSAERWSKLQGNYEFDASLGLARCREMSSNIAYPSPGDPSYREKKEPEEILTFADLPMHDRAVIERESNAGDPEMTREVLIECALKYQRVFGSAHAHEFGGIK